MDYRVLLKKLEQTLEKIDESQATPTMLQSIMESIVLGYGKEIGITAGRLYEQTNNHYQLISQAGESHAPENYRISMEYGPIQHMRREGHAFVRSTDPDFDPEVEAPLGVSYFAAITVGDNDEYVISFTLMEPVQEEHVHYALTTIRHVANLKIRTRRLEGYIAEARKIQMNLLPQEFPQFFDYDIFGRSLPAEIVGGDVFDVIPISDNTLGLVIADASGHGLPAALQVRDVIVGLRMGIEKDLKIVRTMQKLNNVLGQANKSHDFISLFYAELEDNGNFFYVNAGHPPALFFGNISVHELNRGGLIMGPYPKAKYERGFVFFEKGNLLVMYTDGVTEATNTIGEEFGVERIKEIIQDHRDASSKELCTLIFKAVEEHTEAAPPKDDRTVLILKKMN
ncbi:MAG TPA: PP2C family protein-serine/threonine phosphatase [Acidobacteriota bacterium]|nr:PP2C family protein-serine/threonine phosphatase [Acidobacteriota bacterium]